MTTADTTTIAAYIGSSVLSRLPARDRTDEAIRYAVARKFGDAVGEAQLQEARRLGEYHRLAHAQARAVRTMRLNGWRGSI